MKVLLLPLALVLGSCGWPKDAPAEHKDYSVTCPVDADVGPLSCDPASVLSA